MSPAPGFAARAQGNSQQSAVPLDTILLPFARSACRKAFKSAVVSCRFWGQVLRQAEFIWQGAASPCPPMQIYVAPGQLVWQPCKTASAQPRSSTPTRAHRSQSAGAPRLVPSPQRLSLCQPPAQTHKFSGAGGRASSSPRSLSPSNPVPAHTEAAAKRPPSPACPCPNHLNRTSSVEQASRHRSPSTLRRASQQNQQQQQTFQRYTPQQVYKFQQQAQQTLKAHMALPVKQQNAAALQRCCSCGPGPFRSSPHKPVANARPQRRCNSAPALRQRSMSAPELPHSQSSTPRSPARRRVEGAHALQPGTVVRLPSPVPNRPPTQPLAPFRKVPQISVAPVIKRTCSDRSQSPKQKQDVAPLVAQSTSRSGPQRAPSPRPASKTRSPSPQPLQLKLPRSPVKAKAPAGSCSTRQAAPHLAFGSPEVQPSEIHKKLHLGSGSFGSVWKAVCRGCDVAIKICQQNSASERRVTLQELGFLRNLCHPRLVSFLGFAQTADQLIFVMELMHGGSLSDLLFCQRRVLSFSQKALMGMQVAEGLTYLHEMHVIHRDLKTMNVVLDASLNCKICDFGLTLHLDRTHVTVCGLQGSPRYMAPEQLETETSVRISEKVDIWQMGCVLLELFCAVVPFSGFGNVAAIISEDRDELAQLKSCPWQHLGWQVRMNAQPGP